MGLHHCGISTTSSQSTVIVGFVLRLLSCDGEGRSVPREGAREVTRDPRGMGVCVVVNSSRRLHWGLLEPAGVVTRSD